MKQNIRHLSLSELQTLVTNWDFKKSKANYIYETIWYRHIYNFAEMPELPEGLLILLNEHCFIPQTKIFNNQMSTDGTIKCSLQLFDKHLIEGVLIPTEHRITVCVSSQVGCSLSCSFCATGYMERKRNVTFDEIVDQVVLLNDLALVHYQKPISNVVYMGMGEPMLNYQNVIQSVEKLTDQKGLSIAPKRITISTAGVAKMIKKLADEKIKINLALSLHAANDKKRNEIMPINESNRLEELIAMLNYFHTKSKNEITLEYILLEGFNDTIEDANELIAFYKKVPVHLVNILEYNSIQNANFQKPKESAIDAFVQHLQQHHINAHLRRSRGKDIAAACGQLANMSTT
ncbi:MAG: 23S rRNA (adenine(2503)-C(2))-methyltransferase RlmN [Phycisphaerales bacterium]|nr:23S rRNA (adenine(2503)-C(2))-methyltransferase RlmN [Phycisphaerales bacterium]